MVFPEGTRWGEETAKVVIGIAGVGDEHLDILSIIAEKMLDEEAAAKLVSGDTDADTIYRILSGKEEQERSQQRTTNPATDKTVEIKTLQPGGLNRIKTVEYDAGGKGINVSKTVKELGVIET